MRVTTALTVLALVAVSALANNKYDKKNDHKKAKKHHKKSYKDTRVCKALINQNGITGFLKFSQPDMHAPVKLEVNLKGLPTAIQGPLPWHIHNNPIEGTNCASAGGYWSPQGLPDVPIGGCMGNMCQIGDLANRIGPFTTPTVKYTVPLPFTTLFGPLSICGRSIVIHNGTTPAIRQACGTITPQYKEVTAVANIAATTDNGSPAPTGTVPSGTVTFKQQKGKPNSEVSVLVVLNAAVGSTGHPYHVHALPVPAGGNNCSATGPHWNINNGPVCTLPQTPLTPFPGCPFDTLLWPFCENGDLAGKHGLLNLPAVGATRLFYHDNQIYLQGPKSIVGLSVVVHQNVTNGFRIACGNIIKPLT